MSTTNKSSNAQPRMRQLRTCTDNKHNSTSHSAHLLGTESKTIVIVTRTSTKSAWVIKTATSSTDWSDRNEYSFSCSNENQAFLHFRLIIHFQKNWNSTDINCDCGNVCQSHKNGSHKKTIAYSVSCVSKSEYVTNSDSNNSK